MLEKTIKCIKSTFQSGIAYTTIILFTLSYTKQNTTQTSKNFKCQ